MPITHQTKEQLKMRLSRAMGHLNAVYRMVDEQKYCIDVLHQLKAVQAALDKTAEEILKQHLHTCVVQAVRNRDEERVIQELLQVFRKAPTLYNIQDAPDASSAQDALLSKDHAADITGCCH